VLSCPSSQVQLLLPSAAGSVAVDTDADTVRLADCRPVVHVVWSADASCAETVGHCHIVGRTVDRVVGLPRVRPSADPSVEIRHIVHFRVVPLAVEAVDTVGDQRLALRVDSFRSFEVLLELM